jgi:hypothetical protein
MNTTARRYLKEGQYGNLSSEDSLCLDKVTEDEQVHAYAECEIAV